ncbi:flagellar biosynthetic protein FliO [Rhizobium wenxiniae]|uniref:flagellar biosynthetic protein FliO n=1 Tax=Rhizobium wenxiniae TaxID=1737357 RepID=UPI001C6E47CB|nr:flagellar biosynthetic protein FliO [Rhizobium wenxiniae]MBW9090211.1 flagellar biosynthetic protein FliO [Rhizobium wenxiniae]
MAELWGEYGRNLVVAVIGVGLALICLVGILWIVRGRRGPSPFVRGGRNRQPRLQVLDAAAVDARRRLVLVRRDDVEHLIMIGGPTDVVIESRITGPARDAENPIQDVQTVTTAAPTAAITAKPAATEPARRPAPAPAPRPEAIKEPMAEVPAREARAVAAPQPAAAPSIPAPRMEPVVAPQPANPARMEPVQSRPRAESPAVAQPALDDAAQLLDSQRNRVFADHNNTAPAAAPVFRPAPQPVTASTERPTGLGSDFEKILEEEMAQNMAAREASLANRPGRPLPQAGPAVAIPVVTTPGAATREDPSLQSEVARIFGEMSASRDK